jgi:peptidyl-prolyl cis-trans isomerase SurA
MKRLASIIFTLFSLSAIYAQPEGAVIVDQVVAVVGDNKILMSDVENQFIQLQQSQPQGMEITRCDVYEDLLFQKLLIHQAEIDSVMVADEEVENNMDRRIDMLIRQIGSQQQLEEFYGKTVTEIKEEMRILMRDQMIAQRMQQQIVGDLEVTPSEIREYYNAIPEDSLPLINSQIEVAQIVRFPVLSEKSKQEAWDRLEEIRQRIEDGSKFSTMAILYSEDPGSARNGGLYEGIKRGQFVKEFEAVAFGLEVGEVSNIFETQYGYHICQLEAKRGQIIDIRHILIVPKTEQSDIEESKRFLDSLRLIIMDGIYSFDFAAEEYSDDKATRNSGGILINPNTGDSKFEIQEVDRSVYFSIENLKVGGISNPMIFTSVDNKQGYRILKLLSRSEPHRANLEDDYQQIEQYALMKKQDEILSKWVEEKIQDSYIRLNDSYLDCEFRYNWVKKENP